MALFQVSSDGLTPLNSITPDSAADQEALVQIMWRSLDDAVGERLYRVYCGPSPLRANRRSVLALDSTGNVVVVQVSLALGVDELAESLEHVGWARGVGMDQLAELHGQGEDDFWRGWQRFGGAALPSSTSAKPRLIVIATEFSPVIKSSVDFLLDYRVPVSLLRASLYQGRDGQQLLEITDHLAEADSGTSEVVASSHNSPVPKRSRKREQSPISSAPGLSVTEEPANATVSSAEAGAAFSGGVGVRGSRHRPRISGAIPHPDQIRQYSAQVEEDDQAEVAAQPRKSFGHEAQPQGLKPEQDPEPMAGPQNRRGHFGDTDLNEVVKNEPTAAENDVEQVAVRPRSASREGDVQPAEARPSRRLASDLVHAVPAGRSVNGTSREWGSSATILDDPDS